MHNQKRYTRVARLKQSGIDVFIPITARPNKIKANQFWAFYLHMDAKGKLSIYGRLDTTSQRDVKLIDEGWVQDALLWHAGSPLKAALAALRSNDIDIELEILRQRAQTAYIIHWEDYAKAVMMTPMIEKAQEKAYNRVANGTPEYYDEITGVVALERRVLLNYASRVESTRLDSAAEAVHEGSVEDLAEALDQIIVLQKMPFVVDTVAGLMVNPFALTFSWTKELRSAIGCQEAHAKLMSEMNGLRDE